MIASVGEIRVRSLLDRIRRIGKEQVLWPGFDPSSIPFALYDGKNTFLFNHPAPPEEFERVQVGETTACLLPGRHEAIVAISCVELGGVLVATLMLDSSMPPLEPDELAAIAIHEMFHVYQSGRLSFWQFANESDRFLYPTTDASIIALRRHEIEALRRALKSQRLDDIAGWAKRAMRARRERFARMDKAFAEYERRAEKIEGVAAYVEALAARRTGADDLDGEQAGEVRRTCYATGRALAVLLDRVAPRWKDAFEDRLRFLDEALEEALDGLAHVKERDFAPNESKRFDTWAREDVKRRWDERLARENAFVNRPGQRFIVESSEEAPLRVFGMDPSNVHLVHRALGVLHTRLLHLRGGESRIEMLREGDAVVEGLTEGVGPHPLFDGVKRAEFVVGEGKLEMSEFPGMLKISGKGIKARLQVRQWTARGGTLRVLLEG